MTGNGASVAWHEPLRSIPWILRHGAPGGRDWA